MSKLLLIFCFVLITEDLMADELLQRLREDILESSQVDRMEASFLFFSIMGLSLVDDEVRDFVTQNRSETLTHISRLAKPYGGKYLPLGICGLSFMYGKLRGDKWAKETALLGVKGCLISSIITGGLQILIGRRRPYEGKGPYSFIGPHLRRGAGGKSFPSGHATVAFALSAVVAERVENRALDFLLYGIASATALSRVYDDAHWISDVAAGAMVGVLVGKAIVKLHEMRKR